MQQIAGLLTTITSRITCAQENLKYLAHVNGLCGATTVLDIHVYGGRKFNWRPKGTWSDIVSGRDGSDSNHANYVAF